MIVFRALRAIFGVGPVNAALAGIVMAFVAIGVMQSVAVPGFRPLDEPRHVGYVVALSHGTLPTVRDTLPFDRLGKEEVRGSKYIAAANHPPLYYAIMAVPIMAAGGEAHLARGLAWARLLTLTMAAAGLVMAFRALRHLVPDRPGVAVLAIAFAAATPAFVNCSSVVMNDSLAFLAAAGLFDVALAILTAGPSRKRTIGLAIWMSVSALTRFAGLLIFAPAIVAVVWGYLLTAGGTWRSRLARAGVTCGIGLASAAISSGYFYYRNYVLYDDITGTKALIEELHRTPRGSIFHHLFNGKRWLDLCDQLFDRLAGGVTLPQVSWIGRFVFVLGFLGLIKCAFDARAILRDRPWRNPRLVGGALVVGAWFGLALSVFGFYARGGGLSPRYYFPVLWGLWFVIALGFSAFTPRFIPAAGAVALTLWSFVVNEVYLSRVVTNRTGPIAAIDGFDGAHVPWPTGAFAVLFTLFAIGLTLSSARIAALHRAHMSVDRETKA
jgi:hypothetical protein